MVPTSVRISKEPRLVKIALNFYNNVIASHAFDSQWDAVSDSLHVPTVGRQRGGGWGP